MLGGGRARPSNPNTVQIKACSFQGVNNVRDARSVDNETESFWLNTFLLRPYHNFKMNMSHLIPERKELICLYFSLIKLIRAEVNQDERALKIALLQKPLENITRQQVRFFMDKDEVFLTPQELSKMLNLSISKLAIDRMRNVGIPFFKYMEGHRHTVRYPMSEVREFINNIMKAI
jgi:hypothetical protein